MCGSEFVVGEACREGVVGQGIRQCGLMVKRCR